jgi:sorbitol-specific phosphotransferase system component IIA
LLVVASVPKTKIVAAFGKRGSRADRSDRDATLEFAAETGEPAKGSGPLPKFNRSHNSAWVAGIVLVALITAGVYWKDRWQPTTGATGGTLRVESDPPGAQVRLNGQSRGVTPLSLEVPAGKYTLTVQRGNGIKEMPVSVTDGVATVHHISWADLPAATAETDQKGQLSVSTDPAGGDVIVDGVTRGAAPLTLRDLPVGEHRVVVRARGTTYTRTVRIEVGTTASLFFGRSEAAATGTIAIESQVPVQVFENKRLIGTSQMDRIILPAGEHALEFVADSVGFRSTQTVHIAAGQTTAVPVQLPKIAVSINALPWAEVFIDGARIGETPLGNVQQTLGPHEIVFRHPQHGERRTNIIVTTKDANRISMDMRQ